MPTARVARTRLVGIGAVAAGLLGASFAEAASAAADTSRPRVVGGTEVSGPAVHPAQASLRQDGGLICGGTMVTARWFLTAAHCVTDELTKLIRTPVGQLSVGVDSHLLSAQTVIGVDRMLVHEGWNLLNGDRNDLALLHLTAPLAGRPQSLIRPSEAPLSAPGVQGAVLGWGVTQQAGTNPDVLRQATVPVRQDAVCASAYGAAGYDAALMLCAGDTRDACSGDSGGPLLVPRGNRLALAGTVSFGPDPCGNPNAPGVYTRLAGGLNAWVTARIPVVRIQGNVPAVPGASIARSGQPVTLSATESHPDADDGTPTYAWDLDADGAFDDATGPTVSPAFPDGLHEVSVQASYAAGERAVDEHVVLASTPAPAPPATTPTPLPTCNPSFTSKLSLARADTAGGRLDVLAPITGRASGRADVEYSAAGRRTRFTANVDAGNRRIRFSRDLPAAQARLGTGIFTITYPGDADTRRQEVRLRAARNKAELELSRPRLTNGVLEASGTVSDDARGVVRLQLQYESFTCQTKVIELQGRIADGRWSIRRTLSNVERLDIAFRKGTVHSYTLFTGYLPERIRGEMRAFQVLGNP